jgi:hypothetical protein
MNLFKKYNGHDEEVAKEALKAIVIKNVTKYVMAQKDAYDLLGSEKYNTKCKKKNKCTLCNIEVHLEVMSDYQGITSEACKMYEMLFDEEIDMDAIKEEVKALRSSGRLSVKEKTGKKKMRDVELEVPEDAPEEIKSITNALQGILRKKGMKDVSVKVTRVDANEFALNPQDYDSTEEFVSALMSAKNAKEAMDNGKSAEDVLNDAVANRAVKSIKPEKLN